MRRKASSERIHSGLAFLMRSEKGDGKHNLLMQKRVALQKTGMETKGR